MKIDKAIEILEDDSFGIVLPVPEGEREALKLGIEALKVVKDAKIVGHYGHLYPLPGETK